MLDVDEEYKLIKLSFPVNVESPRIVYSMPYGFIEKAPNGEEDVAHEWADIIDGNKGGYFRKGESKSELTSCNEITRTADPVRKKATVQACSNELNVQIGLFLDTRAREARQQDKR